MMYAVVDTRASHNFMKLEVAKRLGVPFVGEDSWLKAVNSHPTPTYGVARTSKWRLVSGLEL